MCRVCRVKYILYSVGVYRWEGGPGTLHSTPPTPLVQNWSKTQDDCCKQALTEISGCRVSLSKTCFDRHQVGVGFQVKSNVL